MGIGIGADVAELGAEGGIIGRSCAVEGSMDDPFEGFTLGMALVK